MIDDFRADGLAHRTLFLTADQETLLARYKETRRRHPLVADRARSSTGS